MQTTNELSLTARQQQAVALIASGKTVVETAHELGVHRSTVWAWKQQEPFQAYLNMMEREAQLTIREGLIKLSEDAIHGLWDVIHHGTPQAAFKACTYVIETVQKQQQPGATDPRALVREQCGEDADAYRQRCEELGIEP